MSVKFTSLSSKRKPADVFILGVFEGTSSFKELRGAEPAVDLLLAKALSKKRFEGKSGQQFASYISNGKEASEILFVGLGEKKKQTAQTLRKTMGRGLAAAKGTSAKSIRVYVDSFQGGSESLQNVAGLVSELDILMDYKFDGYKQSPAKEAPVKPQIEGLLAKAAQIKAVEKSALLSRAIAEGMVVARDLINEPANVMHPQRLALEAKKLAGRKNLICEVLSPAEIKRLKMGGVLGVNQGSPTPPAFIILEHGRKYKSKGTICLVGKGVTFDTGGLSIKPAKGMEKMKYDMSGGAGVIGTMSAVADLKLQQHVVGLVPAVENNVAEDPIRPGDILKMFNGKSVEVVNTDAEGRLILADALAYAEKYSPKAMINMATLTGMAAATFGSQCCAVLGNNEKLIASLKKVGDACGERAWQLPMYAEYGEQLKGYHSDLLNVGPPFGGTITAAKFLENFVPEKTAWAHLDIAGVAWCESPQFDCPIGGTGFGVKLLTHYLVSLK